MSRPALVVTGASGLLGTALSGRRTVTALPRSACAGLWWEPAAGRVHDPAAPAETPVGAVVHLAGAGVADERWSDARKAAIYDSRVRGTATLVQWLAGRRQRPAVLVCASAVGIYGERGDELLPESAARGEGFLAEVCAGWEAEAAAAADVGVRVVCLRFGIVLSPEGGALARMLPVFRLGGGGRMGSGQQWFPWVHVNDALGAIEWALSNEAASGVYNVVAPGIVRQADFARTLGGVLRRPARLPAPATALRVVFGRELADSTVLVSQRAVPQQLLDAGFAFRAPELRPALEELVRR